MRSGMVALLGIAIVVGASCLPGVEASDYRIGIKKDFKALVRPDCPPGSYLDLRCKDGRRGKGCPERCVPRNEK